MTTPQPRLQIMTLALLGLLLAAYLVYVAVTPRETLEFHLFILWALMALPVVVSLLRLLFA